MAGDQWEGKEQESCLKACGIKLSSKGALYFQIGEPACKLMCQRFVVTARISDKGPKPV